MARFVAGEPIRTAEPTIVVDAGLPVGEHRFELVVTTDDGRSSRPDVVSVQVVQLQPMPVDQPR